MNGTILRELRATALGLLIVALYTALILGSGAVGLTDFGLLLGRYLKGAFALWLLVGLVAPFFLLYSRRASNASPFAQISQWAVERWRRDRFLSLVWPPALFAILMASFNAYKQMVLRGAGFRFDPLFAELDRMLFLGVDPWRVTHHLFASPWASYFMDKAYHGWFLPMSLGVIVCAFLPASSWRLRTQYLLSYVTIWIFMGSILAYLLPAAGPCFYSDFVGASAHFDPLMSKLANDQAIVARLMPDAHLAALSNQEGLLRAYGMKTLVVGGGISAMPSVHNALAVLFAIAGFRVSRRAGWVMTAYALLIWIGSIHLGWHYAIDGIVAVLLTLGIWKITGRIADWLDRGARRTPAETPVLAS